MQTPYIWPLRHYWPQLSPWSPRRWSKVLCTLSKPVRSKMLSSTAVWFKFWCLMNDDKWGYSWDPQLHWATGQWYQIVDVQVHYFSWRLPQAIWPKLQGLQFQCHDWMGKWGGYTWTPLNHCCRWSCNLCHICQKEQCACFERWHCRWAKKLLRMVNQAKPQSYYMLPCYKYGYEVPWNYNYTAKLDKCNGNTKWQDSIALEMTQLMSTRPLGTWAREQKYQKFTGR